MQRDRSLRSSRFSDELVQNGRRSNAKWTEGDVRPGSLTRLYRTVVGPMTEKFHLGNRDRTWLCDGYPGFKHHRGESLHMESPFLYTRAQATEL